MNVAVPEEDKSAATSGSVVQGLLAGEFLFACLTALEAAAGLLHCFFIQSVPATALGTDRAFAYALARWRFSTGKQNSG